MPNMFKFKDAHDVIIKPIITEASTSPKEEKRYVFKVAKNANKIEIKKALKELFDVDVEKVNTLTCKGRKGRFRFGVGHRPDWKKAIVKLKQSSKTIEFFDNMF